VTEPGCARLAEIDLDALVVVIHIDQDWFGTLSIVAHGTDELGRRVEVLRSLSI
jgi:hypothetical protein